MRHPIIKKGSYTNEISTVSVPVSKPGVIKAFQKLVDEKNPKKSDTYLRPSASQKVQKITNLLLKNLRNR